jgi:glycosyltransferase involved in cell wall biosynthesis
VKISIVTISFNQAAYLEECIESVLSQQVDGLEYIVVDPGSTDGSREIINRYSGIIRIFEPDQGPADGLNRGFHSATGGIFGFLNADDYLLPGALAKVVTELKDGRSKMISGSGISLYKGEETRIRPTLMTLHQLLYRSARIFQQSTFFHRDVYERVGGFNMENRTCWDYELFADMAAAGAQHKIISDELGVFRLHDESISGSGRLNEAYKRDLDRIFLKHKGRAFGSLDQALSLLQRAGNRLFA